MGPERRSYMYFQNESKGTARDVATECDCISFGRLGRRSTLLAETRREGTTSKEQRDPASSKQKRWRLLAAFLLKTHDFGLPSQTLIEMPVDLLRYSILLYPRSMHVLCARYAMTCHMIRNKRLSHVPSRRPHPRLWNQRLQQSPAD